MVYVNEIYKRPRASENDGPNFTMLLPDGYEFTSSTTVLWQSI